MKIFVIDGRSLAALAAIRSLGRIGHTIHCGESFRHNLSSYSRFVDKRMGYPAPDQNPDEFIARLLKICRQEEYDLVLPARDDTTALLSKNKNGFDHVTTLYLPEYDTLSPLMDKGKTIKIAQQASVPTPETWLPEETPREQIKSEVDYPILVRPRRSSGSRGIKHVSTPSKFDEAFEFVAEEYGPPMVQEYIEKSGYTTACILFDADQRLVGEFSYERQKEYPLSGGPTVVGESTDDQEAKRYARQLLGEAGWKGAAEVEFILDQDGVPRLLEVNPRFWMPIQLAISSGVDFPRLIQQLADGKEPARVDDYKTGLTYRWVLPNEILWSINSDDKLSAIRNLFAFNPQTQCYGTLSIRDPGAAVGTVAQSLRFLADAEMRRKVFDRGW